MSQKNEMELSRVLFWDTNYDTIDWEKHAVYVIDRVLSLGNLEDFKAALKYYGKQKLKETALQLRYLDHKTLSFCSYYFNEPIQNFRCYTYKQLNRTHWDY